MVDEDDRPGDELIARIAGGDREAFAALYRRHRSDVYRFALHVCGSSSLAEDVVQDVFVCVIEYASRYQPGRSGVVPWLLGITRNHLRRWRCERSAVPLPSDDSDEAREIAVVPDPLGEVARRQNTTALRRALMQLPVRYREVIVLCELHELSYIEAAGILCCPVGTVRSRLHRGRALLAEYLRGRAGGYLCRIPATRPIV